VTQQPLRQYGSRPCYTQAPLETNESVEFWPTHEDGTPKRIAELSPVQQQSWFARGLRAAFRAFELADEAKRARLERW
jgi:hypothetical protein